MSDTNYHNNDDTNESLIDDSITITNKESTSHIKNKDAPRTSQFNSSSISDKSYPAIPFVACECARPENDLSLGHPKIECAVEYDESDPGAKSFSPKQMDVNGLKTKTATSEESSPAKR